MPLEPLEELALAMACSALVCGTVGLGGRGQGGVGIEEGQREGKRVSLQSWRGIKKTGENGLIGFLGTERTFLQDFPLSGYGLSFS